MKKIQPFKEKQKKKAEEHHLSQVNAVTKCRYFNETLFNLLGKMSMKSVEDRNNSKLLLNATSEDDVASIALMLGACTSKV